MKLSNNVIRALWVWQGGLTTTCCRVCGTSSNRATGFIWNIAEPQHDPKYLSCQPLVNLLTVRQKKKYREVSHLFYYTYRCPLWWQNIVVKKNHPSSLERYFQITRMAWLLLFDNFHSVQHIIYKNTAWIYGFLHWRSASKITPGLQTKKYRENK